MTVRVSQARLSAAIATVKPAVAKLATLPVLSHVLMQTRDGGLMLAASDLELTICASIAVESGQEPASLTVPARVTGDLVNALSEQIDLAFGENAVTISCAGTEANVKGIPADEFPLIPTPVDEPVSIDAQAFKAAIDRVVFAAASDESRPVLTGVYCRFDADSLVLCAADGFRLGKASAPLGVLPGKSAIIPARALSELGKLLDKPAQVTVQLEETRAFFSARFEENAPVNQVTIITQLINGDYPDFGRIIPTRHALRVEVGRGDLLGALKRAGIVARTQANMTTLDIEAGRLTVAATSVEAGDVASEVDADVQGDPLEIAFSVRYLLEGVDAVASERIEMLFTDRASPVVLHPVGDDSASYTYVIMPMQPRGTKESE